MRWWQRAIASTVNSHCVTSYTILKLDDFDFCYDFKVDYFKTTFQNSKLHSCHGRLKENKGALPLYFEISHFPVNFLGFSLCFELVKWNFTTVGPPGKNATPRKILLLASRKKSFRRPWLQVIVVLSNVIPQYKFCLLHLDFGITLI